MDFVSEFLKDSHQLTKFVGANNLLNDVDGEMFSHLKYLIEIDFSLNEFTKISTKVEFIELQVLFLAQTIFISAY